MVPQCPSVGSSIMLAVLATFLNSAVMKVVGGTKKIRAKIYGLEMQDMYGTQHTMGI